MARSRVLFARHAEDDHLRSTVRETMLIGPLRGVVTRENARTTRRAQVDVPFLPFAPF